MSAPRRTLRHSTGYRDHRAAAYPGIGDALDALMKGLAAYHRREPLPADTLAYIEACEEVKARFPKAAPVAVPEHDEAS